MTLSPITRSSLALGSACGLAGSVLIYIESSSGVTIVSLWPWEVALGAGVIALGIAPRILGRLASKSRGLAYWKEFERGMPRWVIRCNYLLMAIVIVHFAWYFFLGGIGMPTIKDGQYILNNHGRIVRVLTKGEYILLNEVQLRIFATLMISSYFMFMMYWYFPPYTKQTD